MFNYTKNSCHIMFQLFFSRTFKYFHLLKIFYRKVKFNVIDMTPFLIILVFKITGNTSN